MVGAGELVAELLAIDPALQGGGKIRDIRTLGRRSHERLPCALCEAAMEPVYLGGAGIDRCRADGVLWFDGGKLAAVMARAADQRASRSEGLLRRLFAPRQR